MTRYYPVDWQDGVLRDAAWLLAQPAMYRGKVILEPRTDLYDSPSEIELDIAVGQGIGGRNALRITNKVFGAMPDFRILSRDKNHPSSGYGVAKPSYADGFLCPAWFKPKKLHLIIKFPDGYRAAHALDTATSASNDQNFHFGTHHFNPGLLQANGFTDGMQESFNWHQYHQLCIRHDLAGNGWVHVVCSANPTHQRNSTGTTPAPDLTSALGRYWDTAVTVYFAPVPYWEADIAVPYVTLVDSIYFTDDDEYQPVKVEFVDYHDGQELEILPNVATDWYAVRLTNTTASSISGIVVAHGSKMTLNLRDASTLASVLNTSITLTAGEVRNLEVRATSHSTIMNEPNAMSVVFVPATEETRARYGTDQIPSKTDPYACYRGVHGYLGPPDADLCHAHLMLNPLSSLTGTDKPWSWGGQKWRCNKNGSLGRQLPMADPQGLPVTAAIIDYNSVPNGSWTHTASGGGTLTVSSSGLVAYTPTTDFEGMVFFRYQLNNGVRNSEIFGNWINVTAKPRIKITSGGKILRRSDGRILMLGG